MGDLQVQVMPEIKRGDNVIVTATYTRDQGDFPDITFSTEEEALSLFDPCSATVPNYIKDGENLGLPFLRGSAKGKKCILTWRWDTSSWSPDTYGVLVQVVLKKKSEISDVQPSTHLTQPLGQTTQPPGQTMHPGTQPLGQTTQPGTQPQDPDTPPLAAVIRISGEE